MNQVKDITRAEAEDIIARKRVERQERIPKEWILPAEVVAQFQDRPLSVFNEPLHPAVSPGILTKRELQLTHPSNDATTLAGMLSRREVSSEEVVTAFCKRAALALQLTNCVSEVMFREAFAQARELDKLAADPKYQPGPLHGIPISVKDTFFVKGFDATNCTPSLSFNPSPVDSHIVQLLRAYGAVIICKTTVPQGLLSGDSDNSLFGRTVNAHKNGFVGGGSSGGEGVLVAFGGSAIGIGSDASGSVRIPALSNGVIGVRPSGYRWPLDGAPVFGRGYMGTTMVGLVYVTGPLCRSMRDARLISRLVSEAEPWVQSPFLNPSPWLGLQIPTHRPIRIAVWHDHDYLHILPPVKRGLDLAESRLREFTTSGPGPIKFDIRPFKGPSIDALWESTRDWCELADLSILRRITTPEPLTEQVNAMIIITRATSEIPKVDLDLLHDMNARIAQLAMGMTRAWNGDGENDEPIDALLWVGAVHPAMPFDKYKNLGITGLFNAIDWPAIILPLNEYVSGEQGDFDRSKKVPQAEIWGPSDHEIQDVYWSDPERFEGLPLTVSLIGRRGLDEGLLALGEVVHDIIQTKDVSKWGPLLSSLFQLDGKAREAGTIDSGPEFKR
jgi:amidase